MRDDIQLLYVDLFCGAGGTSTGVEYARTAGRKCEVGGMSILDAQAKNAVLWAKALIKAIDAENR